MTLNQIRNAGIILECYTTCIFYILDENDEVLYEQLGQGGEILWQQIPRDIMSRKISYIGNYEDDFCIKLK